MYHYMIYVFTLHAIEILFICLFILVFKNTIPAQLIMAFTTLINYHQYMLKLC